MTGKEMRRLPDDLGALGSGLRARKPKGSPHVPKIPLRPQASMVMRRRRQHFAGPGLATADACLLRALEDPTGAWCQQRPWDDAAV